MHHDEEPTFYKVLKDIFHEWKIETLTIPETTTQKHFWICRRCGASGGPSPHPEEHLDWKSPVGEPFLAGTPLQPVSTNCDEARKQIDAFVARCPDWKGHVDRARGAG